MVATVTMKLSGLTEKAAEPPLKKPSRSIGVGDTKSSEKLSESSSTVKTPKKSSVSSATVHAAVKPRSEVPHPSPPPLSSTPRVEVEEAKNEGGIMAKAEPTLPQVGHDDFRKQIEAVSEEFISQLM